MVTYDQILLNPFQQKWRQVVTRCVDKMGDGGAVGRLTNLFEFIFIPCICTELMWRNCKNITSTMIFLFRATKKLLAFTKSMSYLGLCIASRIISNKHLSKVPALSSFMIINAAHRWKRCLIIKISLENLSDGVCLATTHILHDILAILHK